jgi:hypothetical protein
MAGFIVCGAALLCPAALPLGVSRFVVAGELGQAVAAATVMVAGRTKIVKLTQYQPGNALLPRH